MRIDREGKGYATIGYEQVGCTPLSLCIVGINCRCIRDMDKAFLTIIILLLVVL